MKNATDHDRREQMRQVFKLRYGHPPSLWVRAPGRVDLMGSHTDYNLGCVLTLAIDRDTWIAIQPREDATVYLHSMNLDEQTSFHAGLSTRNLRQPWSQYPRGVAWALQAQGLPLRGFNGVLHSTVPIGSGLSSSAALECAIATAFESLGGWRLDPVQKALICQRAENEFVGVNCGILDQYTSCMGQQGCALLLDCRELSSQAVKLDPDIRVVICDTRFKRELAASEYGRRRIQCEAGARLLKVNALRDVSPKQFGTHEKKLPPQVARRCRFIVEENDRVFRMARALNRGGPAIIRRLCEQSFQGALTLYEIGVPAMKTMMEAMLGAPGIIGARQAGAGFGGCMVAFVYQGQVEAFAAAVRVAYEQATGVVPEIYPVEAAGGTGRL